MKIGWIALVLTSAAFGHHSFDAEFDGKKPVSVDGIVTQSGMDQSAFLYFP